MNEIEIGLQNQITELRKDIEALQGILLSLANQLHALTNPESKNDA